MRIQWMSFQQENDMVATQTIFATLCVGRTMTVSIERSWMLFGARWFLERGVVAPWVLYGTLEMDGEHSDPAILASGVNLVQ